MGFKRKFEIGDKVQVIKPNDFRNNQIGKITHYYSSYGSKGVYTVSFKNGTRSYYPYELEKIEDSSNIDTKSNKLSISDLRPGMKVRIRPDLKEGQSIIVYVAYIMIHLKGTIHTIKEITLNNMIILNDSNYTWDIDCFSEIVEESKEEINISENIELPLKEGQVVTLLDGEKYQKIEDNSSKSLTISDFKIGMKIKVKKDFDKIVPISTLDLFHFYHIPIRMKAFEEKELIVENVGNCFITAKNLKWYPEWLEIIEESQIFCENESSLTKVSEETGIITKVTFTLNEFKSEKLEHSKFTIL